MPQLTAIEFIDLYKNSPENSLEWINSNEANLPMLFTTKGEFELLIQTLNDKIGALTPNELHPCNEVRVLKPILTLCKHVEAQIADMYLNFSDVLKICQLNRKVAWAILHNQPIKLSAFINSYEQLIELAQVQPSLVRNVIEHAPEKIDYIDNEEQFLNLSKISTSLIYGMMLLKPEKVIGFINSYECFLNIVSHGVLSESVFQSQPQKMVGLIQSFEQLMGLIRKNSILAEKMFIKFPKHFSNLITSFESFIELLQASSSFACIVSRASPNNLVGFIDSYSKFLVLTKMNHWIASDLFKHADERLVSYITNYEELMALHQPNSNLIERIFKLHPAQIVSFIDNYERLCKLAKTELAVPVFNHSPDTMIDLINDHHEYLQILRANVDLGIQIFNRSRDKIINLLDEFNDLRRFARVSPTLCQLMWAHSPDRVVNCIRSFENFLELESLNIRLLRNIFEHNPAKIIGIIQEPEQFIRLASVNPDLAVDILEKDRQFNKIASKFTSDESLRQLKQVDTKLERIIRQLRPPQAPSIPPMATRQSVATPTPLSTDNAPSNSRFYLKMMCAIASASGIAMLVIGLILLQPALALTGGLTFIAGAAGLTNAYLNNDETDTRPTTTVLSSI